MFKKIKKLLISDFQENLSKKEKKVTIIKEKPIYVRPVFVPLTQEEIDAIHARGHITQEEKVKEWEGMGLCAPGDAWRCKKFHHNCHDCLIDYSLSKLEYESFASILKSCRDDFQKELKKIST